MYFIVTSNGTGSSQTVLHPDTVTVSEMKLTPEIHSSQEVLATPSIVAVPENTHTSSKMTSNGDAAISSSEIEEDIPGMWLQWSLLTPDSEYTCMIYNGTLRTPC